VEPGARVVVVDLCEVSAFNGMVTLRGGNLARPPACVALPPSPDLADLLRRSSLDAEETYWQVLPDVVKGVAPGDSDATVAAMETWLSARDWQGLIRRIPRSERAPGAIVTSWGYVGLSAAPPYASDPVLAIFDPMQLRRLAPSLQGALATAAARPPAPPARSWPQAAAAAVRDLAARPWPPAPPPGYREPTTSEAAAAMRAWYRDYLAREPYARPASQDLPL
jgi:hypothetical protein